MTEAEKLLADHREDREDSRMFIGFPRLTSHRFYDALSASVERLKKLERALEYYAHRDHWQNQDGQHGVPRDCIDGSDCDADDLGFHCGGRRARQALSGGVEG